MVQWTLVLGMICLFGASATAAPACYYYSGSQQPGAKLLVLSGEAEVTVTFCGGTAGYSSETYLVSPGTAFVGKGNYTAAGTQYHLGVFGDGQELVFGIYVTNTGYWYYTGPGSRNPDGLVHAAITNHPADNTWHVGFEDLYGGGDKDYDDINIIIEGNLTVADPSNPTDVDGDGVADYDDNCPLDPNADQANADGDYLGDVCDPCPEDPDGDTDQDGTCDSDDVCPADAENDADQDGICGDEDECPYDAGNDPDGDDVCAAEDNCPDVANQGQADTDGDGWGNACDDDIDGDGIPNGQDNCPADYNPDQADSDGDGVGDACPIEGLVFTVLHANCNYSGTQFHFYINDEYIGSRNPTVGCTCNSSPAVYEFNDPATLALIKGGGCDLFRVEVDNGYNVAMGYILAEILLGSGATEATCVTDGYDGNLGTCAARYLCSYPYYFWYNSYQSVEPAEECYGCPDQDNDGVCDDEDGCPTDPAKVEPGLCGCGVADTDSDGDGTPDCLDACPADPNKIDPGQCGCGVVDTDTDGDGIADCIDICPFDPTNDGSDADGVCDDVDNCIGVANADQANADGDAEGDVCDICPYDAENDADGDSICGDVDLCAGTVLPEGVPMVKLGVNRWADTDGDGVFDTTAPKGQGTSKKAGYTIEDTGGCSCEQIIQNLKWAIGEEAKGHVKFGCSTSLMDEWIAAN